MKRDKLQFYRSVTQIIFLVLLMIGMFLKLELALMVFLPVALIVGNFYCGWICPFGTIQDIFGRIGRRFLKKQFKMPYFVQKYLQFSRYLLALAFVVLISKEAMEHSPINALNTFIKIETNQAIQTSAIVIMGSFVIIGIFFERPFCNYFCSEAIRYGLLSLARVFTIKRNVETCVDCKKCDQACPMNIQVSVKKTVRNAQCINCFRCMEACQIKDTLTFGKIARLNKKK